MEIYLDNAATTALDLSVLEAMMPYFNEKYANAHSAHISGLIAAEAVNKARIDIAQKLGAATEELIFTSGATEGIQLCFKLLASTFPVKKKIISCRTEHKAVLDELNYYAVLGYSIQYLPIDKNGNINLKDLENAIDDQTLMVCLMWINNETGVFHPIDQIAKICRTYNVYYLTDATQGIGKVPFNFNETALDFAVFSAHKFNGPKGIGGLLIDKKIQEKFKKRNHSVERGLRSGTLNVPGIVGLAAALALAEMNQIKNIKLAFESAICEAFNVEIIGSKADRSPYISYVCFKGYEAEHIVAALGDIAVSDGSACTVASVEPSHVLMAMGYSETEALSCVRFSWGRYNLLEEVPEVINKLRQILNP